MITIYGTNTCTKCKMAVRFCTDKNIEHTYVDLTQHASKETILENARLNGIFSLPIIEKEGAFVDFDAFKKGVVQ